MLYHHYFPHKVFLLAGQSINWTDWLLPVINILVVVGIAFYANKIAKKQLNLKDFAEIFIQPKKLSNSAWEFQVKNGSSRIVYITKIDPETQKYKDRYPNLNISRNGKLSLPAREDIYYTLPIPKADQVDNEIRINIEFEDNLKQKYRSHHVAWFQPPDDIENGVWGMQNLKAEKI